MRIRNWVERTGSPPKAHDFIEIFRAGLDLPTDLPKKETSIGRNAVWLTQFWEGT